MGVAFSWVVIPSCLAIDLLSTLLYTFLIFANVISVMATAFSPKVIFSSAICEVRTSRVAVTWGAWRLPR